MNIEKVFKNLIIAQFVLFVLIIVSVYFAPSVEYVESTISNNGIALLVMLVVLYINYFLLFTFRPIGKVLYIPILLVLYTLNFNAGPVDVDSYVELLDYLSTMIEGMLIAMLYFTDIKNKFISS
jgi:hypothetical protein